jgi:hypothetical protein
MLAVTGFYNETWIERDPAFAPLRQDGRFREILARSGAGKMTRRGLKSVRSTSLRGR